MDDALRQELTRAREAYGAGEYDQAERLLRHVAEKVPKFADVHNMLGVIYYTRGHHKLATQHLEEALRINPRYTEAALNLSVAYNESGRYAEAKAAYARAMAASGGKDAPAANDPYVKGKLANMHGDLGEAYREAGLLDESVREYTRALELCPTFSDLRTRLGVVLRDAGRLGDAASELERIRAERPDYVPARVHLGLTYYSMQRADEAVKEWEAVLAIAPDHKIAKTYLAMVKP